MSGSGGGSSGAVSYPAYMQLIHGLWLDGGQTDTPDNSLTETINAAYGNSPHLGRVAYDPTGELATAYAAVSEFSTRVGVLNPSNDYTVAFNTANALIDADSITIDEGRVTADIAAFDAILTDQLEDISLPQFRVGMLNIGAVNTSAFVVGESLLRAYKARDVAKYGTELRVQLAAKQDEINSRFMLQRTENVRVATTQILTSLLKRVDLSREVAALTIEAKRIHIVAKKEQLGEQADWDEEEAKWDLELFSYAQNLLAGPSGGVGVNQKRPSKAVSAIGGALSGAATGAAVSGGNPYVAAAGAVVGAGLALL